VFLILRAQYIGRRILPFGLTFCGFAAGGCAQHAAPTTAIISAEIVGDVPHFGETMASVDAQRDAPKAQLPGGITSSNHPNTVLRDSASFRMHEEFRKWPDGKLRVVAIELSDRHESALPSDLRAAFLRNVLPRDARRIRSSDAGPIAMNNGKLRIGGQAYTFYVSKSLEKAIRARIPRSGSRVPRRCRGLPLGMLVVYTESQPGLKPWHVTVYSEFAAACYETTLDHGERIGNDGE
jgi:hypothetical protein